MLYVSSFLAFIVPKTSFIFQLQFFFNVEILRTVTLRF